MKATLAAQRGLTLIELMVGLAIGLIVTAIALLALTQHLRESRGLLTELRLTQDLQASTDLIAHDLRRAGYWADAASSVGLGANALVPINPASSLELAGADAAIRYSYARDAAPPESLAYRLHQGTIEMKLGDGHWQAMTDSNTLRVLAFRITPQIEPTLLPDFCSTPCTTPSDTCPPRQWVRSLALDIEAQAANDPTLQRSVQTRVRLRNDALTGACPA